MTDNHPMTPSPSQLDQWEMVARATTDPSLLNEPAIRAGHFGVVHRKALRLAFAAGADQELEAILKLAGEPSLPEWDRCFDGFTVASLREERRPKPPTLKEQALTALHAIATGANDTREQHQDFDTIRQALEQLND
jgi:hypothetical protein